MIIHFSVLRQTVKKEKNVPRWNAFFFTEELVVLSLL